MNRIETCLLTLTAPVLVSAACLMLAPPACAQVSVYDPANHTQNVLQAVRALQELDNQVRQISHEIDMIGKMARDLETLPVNVANAIIRDRMTRIEEIIREAGGIGTGIDETGAAFDRAYPQSYGDDPPGADALLADARARWEASLAAHRQVLLITSEARAGNSADAGALSDIVAESQGAAGNLQALQAGNQISALTTQQLMQVEALLGASARAASLEEARNLAEAERGRARLRAFLGD